MTNKICCGGVIREEEASSSFPNIPPDRTKNCYKEFNYDTCDQNCCERSGTDSPFQCKPDSFGGYCQDETEHGYKYLGGNIVPITPEMISDQYSRMDELYAERDRRLRQRMRRAERVNTINLLRQSEIISQLNPTNRQSTDQGDTNQGSEQERSSSDDSVSNLFQNIGIGFSTIVILFSVFLILMKNGIIKFHK